MGVKYPKGSSPIWPPRDWECPECGHHHDKPHFPYKGQVDYTKAPQDPGRVKFNRVLKSGKLDTLQPIDKKLKGTGPMILEEKVQGLFCPHCGWVEDIITIMKDKDKGFKKKGWFSLEKLDCSIQGCKKKASYTNQKLHFCLEHYKEVNNE